MKKLIGMFLVVGVLSSAHAYTEYGYFYRSNHTSSFTPENITLNAGDKFVMLRDSGEKNWTSYFDVSHDGNTYGINLSDKRYDSGHGYMYEPENMRTIAGPRTLTPRNTENNALRIDYKIVRAHDTSLQPSNVISLPADFNGDMEVIVETTTDLLNWSQVYSFTHNSTSQGSRFFRTRVIQSGE